MNIEEFANEIEMTRALNEQEEQQPPKTMKDLEGRVLKAGVEWRDRHTKTIYPNGMPVTKIEMPKPYDAAQELNNIVTFTFISKEKLTDKSPLYMYHLDEGIYFNSDDYFNKLCRLFDSRIDPIQWKKIEAMIRTMTMIQKPLEAPNLIPVGNGVFDLDDQSLHPFDTKYIITSKVRTNYTVPKVTPKGRDGLSVEKWFESIAVGDSEVTELLWQIILEAINPNYTRGKFAILYGSGNNGKGTFQQMLINLIGVDRVGALKPSQFSKEHDLETLVGKVCNIGDDVPSGHLKDTANLMSIATGDTVFINPKNKKGFEVSLKLFNLFSGNYIPTSGNKEEGWYRRIIIVPFNADFNGQVEKPWIKNEFLADKKVLEYILFKALHQPQFEKFIEPNAVKALVNDYREDNDYILTYVKNVYMRYGWHELPVVPNFMVQKSLREFSEDNGIMKPNLARASKTVIKHLEKLTGNRYDLKTARVKKSDIEKLSPLEFEEKKLSSGAHHSICRVNG